MGSGSMLNVFVTLIAIVAVTPASFAQGERGRSRRESGGEESKKEAILPYDEVIKEDFITSRGLFIVHRDKEKLFYEIPRKALGKDLLWVTQIEQTQSGFGYGVDPREDC